MEHISQETVVSGPLSWTSCKKTREVYPSHSDPGFVATEPRV